MAELTRNQEEFPGKQESIRPAKMGGGMQEVGEGEGKMGLEAGEVKVRGKGT